MRKFIFAIIFCLAMIFASCGNQTKSTETTQDTIVCGIDSAYADSLANATSDSICAFSHL
jgi:ABC-type branched-subunit amino acid transport system substrate-binding protein